MCLCNIGTNMHYKLQNIAHIPINNKNMTSMLWGIQLTGTPRENSTNSR